MILPGVKEACPEDLTNFIIQKSHTKYIHH